MDSCSGRGTGSYRAMRMRAGSARGVLMRRFLKISLIVIGSIVTIALVFGIPGARAGGSRSFGLPARSRDAAKASEPDARSAANQNQCRRGGALQPARRGVPWRCLLRSPCIVFLPTRCFIPTDRWSSLKGWTPSRTNSPAASTSAIHSRAGRADTRARDHRDARACRPSARNRGVAEAAGLCRSPDADARATRRHPLADGMQFPGECPRVDTSARFRSLLSAGAGA